MTYACSILENLTGKNGRSLAEWVRLVREEGPRESKAGRMWLKEEHGLGGTSARMIVDRAHGRGEEDTDSASYLAAAPRYVEAMFEGAKSDLRPILNALLRTAVELGSDVKICPCRTIVPLYRRHVFAQIKPSNRSRLDLGLALRGIDQRPPSRLIETGGIEKGDRITHRIPLGAVTKVDDEVFRWLRVAYDQDS